MILWATYGMAREAIVASAPLLLAMSNHDELRMTPLSVPGQGRHWSSGAVAFDAPEITKFWSALLLLARQLDKEPTAAASLSKSKPAGASSLEAEAALV
jgi:hypothetical protein